MNKAIYALGAVWSRQAAIDPFDGKPLRMKRTARGIIVYSIGPDGKDDGGNPFDDAEKTGDITFDLRERKQPAI